MPTREEMLEAINRLPEDEKRWLPHLGAKLRP